MPSTFTTSGVELIADGEQSGAWGQTTNVNLQIIDRMTSQAGTITLSGTTHTLTVSNGILSDGQYNVLVFAGSPSGTNTVTISPNTTQRTFFVRNTTAQSVVLTQGSGGNVTVLAGTARIVYTNGGGTGAAVFDITNTLAANTAATLQTARTIGGVSFNGSANINLPGVNQVGNQNTTGSAASLTTARTIGGVSFNGTANIDLPGVNQAGNQNTTGSAASLTTARTFTIGSTGKTFNGTANVAWTLAEIGVNNATLTLATSGIATGSQTFTANQGTNATFTVNVPATNLTYSTAATTGTVNSSTGTNATIPAATTSLAGLMTNTDKTKLDGIAAGAQVNVATNLGYTTAASTGTVTSSTGTNATLPAATTSLAGLLTGADKTKLDGIAAGAQVNVATNLGYTGAATTGTVTSSTGTNATLPAATTSVAGLLTGADKTKLDGIAAGAQVNVATNLSVTGGTTAGPTINSSTGTNATIPTASGTVSGAVTTGAQTFAGVKTFSTAIAVTGTSKAAGQFYAGTTAPTNTTRLNYDGAFHATSFVGNGSGLTNLPAPPSSADFQEFLSSGTWTKPAGTNTFYVEVIAGGGGGAAARRATVNLAGGSGGLFLFGFFQGSAVGSTETVTVGAGGAAQVRSTDGQIAGNVGGNSSFGSLLVASNFSAGNQTLRSIGVVDGVGPATIYGGAAGGGLTFDGAGNSGTARAGGTSLLHGDGGAANVGGNVNRTATSGTFPGGGGGSCAVGNATATSGAGAAGRVRVWAW